MDKNKTFYIEAYEFISGLLEYISRVSDELSKICVNDYNDKFRICKETVNRLNNSIGKFVGNWGNDDEKICNTLKTIKEYYGFYCVTLNNSSPTTFKRDSKYIIESLYTSKLALTNKLKHLKEKI